MKNIQAKRIADVRLLSLPGKRPEDVVVNKDGFVFTALVDTGVVIRIDPETGENAVMAKVGGRPLGLELFPNGDILVCNSEIGLQRVNPVTGEVTLLLDKVLGKQLTFCNNAAIASDGSIYFSESSRHYNFPHFKRDIIEDTASGRLFCFHPNGDVEVLLDGLHFANGVALAPDESYVLVCETSRNRIIRYWLKDDKRSTFDYFADELPGMPDNLSVGSDGLLWLAIPEVVNKMLESVHRLPKFLRKLIASIPENLLPPTKRCFRLMAFDFNGNVVHYLTGDPKQLHQATGAREHNGIVYVGNIALDKIAMFKLNN